MIGFFVAALASEERFLASIRKNLNPHRDGRQVQELILFGFFVAGLATINSFADAAFAIGAMLRPEPFPVDTSSFSSCGSDRKSRILPPARPHATFTRITSTERSMRADLSVRRRRSLTKRVDEDALIRCGLAIDAVKTPIGDHAVPAFPEI